MNAIASGRDSFPLRPLALFLFTLDWFIAALLAVIGLSMVNWVKKRLRERMTEVSGCNVSFSWISKSKALKVLTRPFRPIAKKTVGGNQT